MSLSFKRSLSIPFTCLLFIPQLSAQYNKRCTGAGKSVPLNPDATVQATADQKCLDVRHSPKYVHSLSYDIASGTYTGDILRGPTVVKVVNLNTIRYNYQFGSATTIAAAPNVWAGLTALATTNAGTTPKVPAATPAPVVTAAKTTPPAAQNRGNRAGRTVSPPSDLFDAVKKVIDDAKVASDKFTQDHAKFLTSMSDYTDPIESLNHDLQTLHNSQNAANQALGLVTQSGSALTTYLTFTRDTSADLIKATETQLQTGSEFMTGTTASWPSPSSIATIQSALANDSYELTKVSAELSGYAPAELATLKASEASMTVLLSQMQAAEKAYESAVSPPDPNKKTLELDAENALKANISLAQNDEAFLNALPAQLTAAIAQSSAAITAATALAPGSTTYTNFVNARETLLGWADKMASVKQKYDDWIAGRSEIDPFSLSRPATCGFAFSSTKDTVVTLSRVDLTPGLSNPAPQTVLSVTVECTSPFILSAGVVFSTIPDPEYTLTIKTPATSMTPAVNSITLVSNSNFHPLPLALASMRAWEPNEHVEFYLSFGVAANIRSQASGGSTAEYLLGPSVGFFRTFLITSGVYFGSEPSIGDGYTLNGTVPSTVTAVPITTNYRPGFGLGITFTTPK